MTFTPVIPTTWDPTRQAVNDFMTAIIAGFMAAVPGVIRKQWSEAPASLTGEGPFVYLGDIGETIAHDAGTRQTVFTGSIGYVDTIADPAETNTRCNAFADYMREVFTANARIFPTGIFQQTGLRDGTELTQGSAHLTDLLVDWTYVVLEGRD